MAKKKEYSFNLLVAVGAIALVVGVCGGYAVGITKGGTPDRTRDWAALRQDGAMPAGGFADRMGDRTDGGAVRRNMSGMDMVSGEIVSVDGNTISVGLEDGNSKVVVMTSETAISELADVDSDALEAGKQVFISAQADDSGNLIATMVQIRPEGMEPFRGGMARPPMMEEGEVEQE